ncbi:hypothetical protein CWI26_10030 [Streptococcus suis]|uniref:Uncharacterized protein n=1 Tax=Streptococcus suis TaxID=1307 RepID=A0A2I5KR17_STRSU|nr:hypothetical protein CWI26_10030 [Streptococcus suis]
MSATSIAGGFLVFLYEKNWLEAIIKYKNKAVARPFTIYLGFACLSVTILYLSYQIVSGFVTQ